MSPLNLRRARAERLLRDEFEALRGRVLAGVRGKLRASGVSLDQDDLEACYSVAWQGLYTVVLDGQEIANPMGWLVLVTFRRAIEEHRSRAHTQCEAEVDAPTTLVREHDLADELDDRRRLRQLFEGLCGRLDGREREAATLCYLQGLSRSEAAVRMGVSETRMRKLMEGRGPGRPGVAAKVGALVGTIRDGDWCEQQGSLMRALAFGMLDSAGERYRLALMHHSQCPACRAYVVSLRGLAAALPPVFLPWSIAAAALARAGEGLHAGAATAAGAGGAGAGTSGVGTSAGVQAGRGLGGAAAASEAAGASGAAGGGWLFGAGPLGAKLAVGCLLALGVGAGCVALQDSHRTHGSGHSHHHALRASDGADGSARLLGAYPLDGLAGVVGPASFAAVPGRAGRSTPLTARAKASREFGPEQALSAGGSGTGALSAGGRRESVAQVATSGASATLAGGGSGSAEGGGTRSAAQTSSGDTAAAEREFSPG